MPIFYEIPAHLLTMVGSQQASLVGAMIRDNATGQIMGHVQQAAGLAPILGTATGIGPLAPFLPLAAAAAPMLQNEGLRRGIAELKDGMILMQNLQYGTLALSGLGLGVSIAGFAATLAKLNAIESRIENLSVEVRNVTADRRDDDIKEICAEIAADMQNIDTLADRRDPQRVAEQLQLSLGRSERKLEQHFTRLADVSGKTDLTMEVLERLWALAAAIRICQEASIQALFMADELEVAEQIGKAEIERQIALMTVINPDAISRLISRTEPNPQAAFDIRRVAAGQARMLSGGLKSAVLSLAGQVSTARMLRSEGISGLQYLREARAHQSGAFLCLMPRQGA